MPDSLWADTARPAPPVPPLHESVQTDVAIVGAGYTGLSLALHLGERGVACRVLDTHEPGWGASGRNGGQVNPTFKHDPDDIERMYGPEQGALLNQAIQHAAEDVYQVVRRHRIDCDLACRGWLQLAHAEKGVAALHARAAKWRARGVPAQEIDREEAARRVGSDAFAGGWFDPRAGSLHPLDYCRGLARAVQAQGGHVHGATAVRELRPRPGSWDLVTERGPVVRAERVVIATNGYTGDLWPGLRQTLLAVNSFIVATEPLSGMAASGILPGRETVANTQRLLLYFRRDAQGRLILGGRGRFGEPRGRADFSHLMRAVRGLFPGLEPPRFSHWWAGRAAVTRDFMPHVHEPAPGLTLAVGYNGRGIAAATCMGRHLARRLTGERDFPFPLSPLAPFPMHRLQRLVITAGVAWYSLLDRIDAA